MRKLTAEQLAELQESGASIDMVKPAKRPLPVKPPEEVAQAKVEKAQASDSIRLVGAIDSLAARLAAGERQLVDKLAAIRPVAPAAPETVKPIPFRFIIKRDKRGLIESVDAYPIGPA